MPANPVLLSDVMSSMFERYASGRQRSLAWTEEDEQKHPRDQGGRWAHTMSRGEFHQQEKVKPGYDMQQTNKTYWAAVKQAALEGKEIHPKADEEHRQIFGEAVPRGTKPTSDVSAGKTDQTPGESKSRTPQATPAAPLLPSSQPTIPGLESEKPNETPRESAARQQAALDADYEFARKSAVRNAGEDLKGSARHKRNEWRGLEAAEKDGTAAELVTRDNLLKAEPHELMKHADKNPLTALAMHFAMRSFPAKPGYGSERRRKNATKETNEKDRRQFLEAYREYKTKTESLASTEPNPANALKQLQTFVITKMGQFRGSAHGGSDPYNNTANSLASTYNDLHAASRKSSSVVGRVENFKEAAREKHQKTVSEIGHEQLADHVKDVIEGRSINEAFGKKGDGKGKIGFTAADKYVKHAIRKGGRDVSDVTGDANGAAKHILEKFGARGVQYGNSVTDDERQHHAAKLVESLADLADVTGLKPQDLGLDGKIGWAIGARGHGTASAHYEPGTQVINLTRKNGVGALAHEWGHAFDHSIHGFKTTSDGGDYASDHISPTRAARNPDGSVKIEGKKLVTENMADDPIWSAFNGVRKAFKSSGFSDRSSREVRKLNDSGELSDAKAKYWNSTIERFARAFETHVQHSLHEKDRENTYLSGLAASGEDSLWPTPAESKAMAPAFESLFATYRQQKYGTDEVQKYSRQDLIDSLASDMVRYSLRTAVERAAAETNVAPSQSQIEAGNYRKGRFRLWGKEIVIENPRGSTRSGVDRDGKTWSNELPHHYGYILRHEGADGDHLDVYIGRHPESEVVFVVDQHDPTSGHFDEHKCFIGFRSAKEAKQCYLDGFSHGGKAALRFGHIATMTKSQFLEWIDGDETKYPVFGVSQVVRYAAEFDPSKHPHGKDGRWAQKRSVKSNVFDGEVGKNFREKAMAWAKREIAGKEFINTATGMKIHITVRSIDKTLSHLPDAKPGLALRVLSSLIEAAIPDHIEPPRIADKNVKGWHYLKASLEIDGIEHETTIKVREDANGSFYYDQHVTQKTKMAPSYKVGATDESVVTPPDGAKKSIDHGDSSGKQKPGGSDKYSRLAAAITRELYAAQRGLFDEAKHPRDDAGKFASAGESAKAGKSFNDWQQPIVDAFRSDQIDEDHPAWKSIVHGTSPTIDDYNHARDVFGQHVKTPFGHYGKVTDVADDAKTVTVTHDDGTNSKQFASGLSHLGAVVADQLNRGREASSGMAYLAKHFAAESIANNENISEPMRRNGLDPVRHKALRRAIADERGKQTEAAKPKPSPARQAAMDRQNRNADPSAESERPTFATPPTVPSKVFPPRPEASQQRRNADREPAEQPSTRPQSVSGQQQGLFDRGEFTTGQKSLFNVIAPDKPKSGKGKGVTSGGDLFAGLQSQIVEHLKAKLTLSPADRGVVVQPESLPGQKEMFARRVLVMVEKYDATAQHVRPAARQPEQHQPADSVPPKSGGGAWQKVGGSSVFVNAAGTITKGCPGLKGHAVGELRDESQESRDRREAKQDHATARGLTGRDLSASAANKFASPRYVAQHQNAKAAAKRSGVATTDVLGAMPGVLEAVSEAFKTREAAKANARRLTGLNAGNLHKIEDSGHDHARTKGFDEAAQSFLYENPEMGFGSTEGVADDIGDKLWDFIKEGKQAIPQLHHASIADEAANMVAARRPTRAQQIASVVSAAFDDSFNFGANVAAF